MHVLKVLEELLNSNDVSELGFIKGWLAKVAKMRSEKNFNLSSAFCFVLPKTLNNAKDRLDDDSFFVRALAEVDI